MSFKNKMKNKKFLGNKVINSNEALGIVFSKETKENFITIPVDRLVDNPYQPRQEYNDDSIEELANSISSNGLLQPIIVSPIKNKKDYFYIVVGHRRVRAFRSIGEKKITAMLVNLTEEQLMIQSLLENVQRENITILDEAFSLKRLLDAGVQQKDLVDKIGKSKGYISKLLSLTNLSNDLLNYIQNNKAPQKLFLLYELSKIDKHKQLKLYKYAIDNDLKREELFNLLNNEVTEKQKVSRGNKKNYTFKKTKNSISFNINIKKISDEEKEIVIKNLEELLHTLKVSEDT